MFRLFSSTEEDASANPSSTAEREQSFLGGVATYLFGHSEPVEKEDAPAKDEVDFDVEEAELDWMLVDTKSPSPAGRDTDAAVEEEDERRTKMEAAMLEAERALEAGPTATSLYQLEREDGWVMTPLPCFTASQEAVGTAPPPEDSPYENLLIEHPSMSVYQSLEACEPREPREPRLPFTPLMPSPLHSNGIIGSSFCVMYLPPPEECQVFLTKKSAKNTRSRASRRNKKHKSSQQPVCQQLVAGSEQRQENGLVEVKAVMQGLKAAQRCQQRKEGKGLSRSGLERQNKSLAVQAMGRSASKRNRARNTSGAMRSRMPQRRH